MSVKELVDDLFQTIEVSPAELNDPETAHLVVHENQVLSTKVLPGLVVEVEEMTEGISANIRLREGTVIKNPVHLCFGLLPEKGLQKIIMRVSIEESSRVSILAHCTFPNAVDVSHIMDAVINVRENASYQYFERHIHGKAGGAKVYPKAIVELERGARFKTDFSLLKGRAGLVDIDYETTCKENTIMDMTARINGSGSDRIKIKEVGYLIGEKSVGVLTSRVAIRDEATADVYNRITASAAYARGHVDCKEIIQGKAQASATPIVEVRHPKAYVTHEAAIGSVDQKQLETLMARGLEEEQAVNLIVQGLLG